MVELILTFVAVGAVAGVLAGLLGIGGGLVIVPAAVFLLGRQGAAEAQVMHLALGTSMASIIFTSISSLTAHHRRGAVDWKVVGRITPGILAGTFLGASLAGRLPRAPLQAFFVIFLYAVAAQMLAGRRPAPSRQMPRWPLVTAGGGVIGLISSLVGIGGGSLSVPYLVWHNLPVHRAIGTSAAIGLPIAVAGTAGYVISGLAAAELPPGSLGYVSLPALAGVVAASVLTAPLGARLAHALPVGRLKQVFAVLLIVVASRMLWGIISEL